jgi:hypothetical protein
MKELQYALCIPKLSSGQLHDPATLILYKELWYPFDLRLGGPHDHSGQGEKEKTPALSRN